MDQGASTSRTAGFNNVDPRARRHPQNLMMEASIRIQMGSISKSWTGVCAGISSYTWFPH